jgi:long-chain acyl-CoA synthetase
MKKGILNQILTILFVLGLVGFARAAEVEGVKLADKVRIGDSGPELLLNGAGVRTRVVFKVYVGALYLPQKNTAANAVINDSGAKRVALHVLRDLTADQLLSALNDGLKANHTPDQLAKLDAQTRQLESIFKSVKAAKNGDTITIDFLGDPGTRITVNGEAKGTITGADFGRALLRVWLGDSPADAALKKAMLGA